MSSIRSDFDAYFDLWHDDLSRLCFLLVRSPKDAREAAFQAFLRLGACTDAELSQEKAKELLFSSAVRICEDYYAKKLRRCPRREQLEAAHLPFPVTDALYAFLRLPLSKRCALALKQLGFSIEETARLMRRSAPAAARLCAEPDINLWQEALAAVVPGEEDAQLLSDRVYERFSERSVGVENAYLDFVSRFERIAPLLALLVLALFAFCIWYVS